MLDKLRRWARKLKAELLVLWFCRSHPDTPLAAKLLAALNHALTEETRFGMFITLLYAVADKQAKTLHYAAAGHDAILRYQGRTQRCEFLKDARSLPVGLSDDAKYEQASCRIGKEDIFLLYTDGIHEARNHSRQEFSSERLKTCFQRNHKTAKEHADHILKEIQNFTQGAPQHDDMTVVVFGLK